MCDSWHSFENFYADMGDPPVGHSLDRIDNSKGYCKDNCRWATPKQQANNTRKNIIVKHRGQKMTLAQLADVTGLPYALLRDRCNKGWNMDEACSVPSRRSPRVVPESFEYRGATYSLAELSRVTATPYPRLRYRIAKGWSVEDAVSTPKLRN